MNAWQADRNNLKWDMDVEITKRKIKRTSFMHDGKLLVAEVGKRSPYPDNNASIRVIYQDQKRGCFVIRAGTIVLAPKDASVVEIAAR